MSTASALRCLILLTGTTSSLACRREEQQPLPSRPLPLPLPPQPFVPGSCMDHPELGWCQTDATSLSMREGAAQLLRGAALDVLAQHCAKCHSSLAPQAAVAPLAIDDAAELVRSGLVAPLSSEQSALFQRVKQGEMPPVDRAPLRAHELDLLALWIDTPSFCRTPCRCVSPGAHPTSSLCWRAPPRISRARARS